MGIIAKKRGGIEGQQGPGRSIVIPASVSPLVAIQTTIILMALVRHAMAVYAARVVANAAIGQGMTDVTAREITGEAFAVSKASETVGSRSRYAFSRATNCMTNVNQASTNGNHGNVRDTVGRVVRTTNRCKTIVKQVDSGVLCINNQLCVDVATLKHVWTSVEERHDVGGPTSVKAVINRMAYAMVERFKRDVSPICPVFMTKRPGLAPLVRAIRSATFFRIVGKSATFMTAGISMESLIRV